MLENSVKHLIPYVVAFFLFINIEQICASIYKQDYVGIDVLYLETKNRRNTDNKIVNVRDFGAKGDGITDDSEALRSAFLHNNVIIPEGPI
jgi:hypothetical protein